MTNTPSQKARMKKGSPEYWRAAVEIWRDAQEKINRLTDPSAETAALSPSEEEIEAAAKALFEFERRPSPRNRRSPDWEYQIPEFHDFMRGKVRAVIAALRSTSTGGEG